MGNRSGEESSNYTDQWRGEIRKTGLLVVVFPNTTFFFFLHQALVLWKTVIPRWVGDRG